jgi:hypothetical protein
VTRDNIKGRRLAGLFLLGMLLFNFPLLSLFNRPVMVLGIPLLYLYLFVAWWGVIALTLAISRSRTDR